MKKQLVITWAKGLFDGFANSIKKISTKKPTSVQFEYNLHVFIISTKQVLEKQYKQIEHIQQWIASFRDSEYFLEMPAKDRIEINTIDRRLVKFNNDLSKLNESISLLHSAKLPASTIIYIIDATRQKLHGIQNVLDKARIFIASKLPPSKI